MSNGFDYLSKWESKKAKIDSLRSLQPDTVVADTSVTDTVPELLPLKEVRDYQSLPDRSPTMTDNEIQNEISLTKILPYTEENSNHVRLLENLLENTLFDDSLGERIPLPPYISPNVSAGFSEKEISAATELGFSEQDLIDMKSRSGRSWGGPKFDPSASIRGKRRRDVPSQSRQGGAYSATGFRNIRP